jgi:hypothetical protein
MISVNVLLSLLFIVSNYVLWGIIVGANWSYYGAVASWSPLFVTPTYPNIVQRPYLMPQPEPLPNVPFYVFWVVMAVDIYFMIRLERGKVKSANNH